MRTFILLSILGLAAASSMEEKGGCLVDGAEAVSDLMDSTMFIWAAVERCDKAGEEIKCSVNIASAIKATTSMIVVILRAVDKCGDLHTEHKKCGLAAGVLVKSMAGLTAASGGIVQKCPGAFDHKPHGVEWNHGAGAQCVVNLKSTAKSLFKAIKALMKVRSNCDGDDARKCASNALMVVASLAGLGEYMAGAIGHCTKGGSADVDCAEQISGLIHHATKVSMAGIDVSRQCEASAPLAPVVPGLVEVQVQRLYKEDEKKEKKDDNSANLLLGAFLPVTAIVSFVGGRFYANHRSRVEQTREFMSDNE